jgi:hypothetical protein
MVIVGASPNVAWAQAQHPENPHQPLGQLGIAKDGEMLLIVIDDEQAQAKQTGENAADYLSGEVNVPDGAGHSGKQQKAGR